MSHSVASAIRYDQVQTARTSGGGLLCVVSKTRACVPLQLSTYGMDAISVVVYAMQVCVLARYISERMAYEMPSRVVPARPPVRGPSCVAVMRCLYTYDDSTEYYHGCLV